MIRAILHRLRNFTVKSESCPVLDLGPYMLTPGWRVQARRAHSRCTRRGISDKRAIELRTARTRFLSAIGEA